MSIATKLGFVIGEKYTVINDPDGDCEVGEVLIFSDDDGSHYPFFENTDGKEVCCYLAAFMTLPQKDIKSEVSEHSVEGLIQKRNESKEALSQAQQALDEKLESLGLQEIGESISPVLEDFDWVEAYWTEFNVGDEIKVVGLSSRSIQIGRVSQIIRECWDEKHLEVAFAEDDTKKRFGNHKADFYKKVTK